MKRHLHPSMIRPGRRSGFTLVEMLVAVGLVLLIMLLFTQIFQIAAGTISVQQGIAQNDQQARLIHGLLRGDLEKRTMRYVLPFAGNENTLTPAAKLDQRRGYFTYVENNPYDDTDDILQFTALVSQRQQSFDAELYLGRAASVTGTANRLAAAARLAINGFTSINTVTLASAPGTNLVQTGDTVWLSGSLGAVNDGKYLVTNISGADVTLSPALTTTALAAGERGTMSFVNEPEFDDGYPSNDQGSSIAAEVAYFLRQGNLFRRVLPIRESRTLQEAQPSYRNGDRVFVSALSGTRSNGRLPIVGEYPTNNDRTSSFWREFDYSAFYFPGKFVGDPMNPIFPNDYLGNGVYFHGTGPSLYNGQDGEILITDATVSPNVTIPVSLGIPQMRFGHSPFNGLPREYLGMNSTTTMSDDDTFMGRFLAQESASINFGYPGYVPAQSPFTRDLFAVTGVQHVIDEYEDAPAVRRGDDLVMTNVLAFDVKAFDPVTKRVFPGSSGFVDLGDNRGTVNEDLNNNGMLDTMPTNEDVNGNGILDVGLYRRTRGGSSPSPSNPSYSPISEDADDDGVLDGGEDANMNGRLDLGNYRFDTWHPRASILGDIDPPFRTDDPPSSGNFPPLAALQITVIFQSQVDGRIRQITIEQSLLDRNE